MNLLWSLTLFRYNAVFVQQLQVSQGDFVKSITLVLALVLGLVTTAMAETRYVSDRLEIQMRTGKGTQFRILRMLPSGTAVEILETDSLLRE